MGQDDGGGDDLPPERRLPRGGRREAAEVREQLVFADGHEVDCLAGSHEVAAWGSDRSGVQGGPGGTPPAEMERDLRELRGLIDRFTRQPRDFELQMHPIFGRLTEEEWMRWGYLHMDHHLRQFEA